MIAQFVIQCRTIHLFDFAMRTRSLIIRFLLIRSQYLLACLVMCCAPLANAHWHAQLDAATPAFLTPSSLNLQLAQATKGVSRSQAANAAQRRYGGKVLSVSRKESLYRVKLLQDSGKVIIVSVDARSGKVSGR
ncbi:PepSY domain-containing protein [Teredinibacter purpureus]|uniref:PepSY domain-containing protein n=1 Tax=Teredinibacter purpureus TaxID=2731756 RepID=UPI001F1DE8D0|nr:PepSY domain-containing protein [Teredinibacter purpureus]